MLLLEKFSIKAVNIYNSVDNIMSSLDAYTDTLSMNEADAFIDRVYDSINTMLDKALINNVINSREYHAICVTFNLCPDLFESLMTYDF